MKLAGMVAIVESGVIAEYRDLGPKPVDVKAGKVFPVIDVFPVLQPTEEYNGFTAVFDGAAVTRTYLVQTKLTGAQKDGLTVDQILGEDGSITRGIIEVLRDEINLLRAAVVPALPPRTKADIKQALRAKMR